jgi:hypothetical protein
MLLDMGFNRSLEYCTKIYDPNLVATRHLEHRHGESLSMLQHREVSRPLLS